jgi:CBS domain-containing protein
MKVSQVCTRGTDTVCVNAPLLEAVRALWSGRAGAVVAIASPSQHPTVLGMLTQQDILQALLEHAGDVRHVRVLDVLRLNPLVLNNTDSVDEAVAQLRARNAQFAPVIGPGGSLTGIASLGDLLRAQTNRSAA